MGTREKEKRIKKKAKLRSGWQKAIQKRKKEGKKEKMRE